MKKSIELFNTNIDLQPAKNWRDLAASGRKSMSYKIFGHAKAEDGSVIAVSASVGAITAEGVIGDLGTAEVPAVSGLLAKNDPRLDTAALKFGPDGQPVRNEDGTPVYDEAPIVCEDGSEFDLAYGTLFFVTLLPGIRLVLDGAELSPSMSNGAQRFAKDSKGNKTIPVFDAAVDGVRVERRAVVSGPGLLGRVRVGATAGGTAVIAARITRDAAPDTAAATEIPEC